MTRKVDVSSDRLSDVIRSQDPYPLLASWREASPFLGTDGIVVVAKHAHCATLLCDPRMSSDRGRARIYQDNVMAQSRNLLNLDPPDHTRIRRLITKAFTPRVVAQLAPLIQRKTDQLIDEAVRKGTTTIEIVGELASPLPLAVICTLLGVPAADHQVLHEWSSSLSQALDSHALVRLESRAAMKTARAQAHIVAYFRDFVARQRSALPDGLIANLLRAERRHGQLSQNELLATCVLLVNAAHETTTNLISNGMHALMKHPDQLRRLKSDSTLARAMVEEVLRYDAPVQLTSRVATADTWLDGYRIKRGDLLVFLLGAANRDPSVFSAPDEFKIDRSQHVPHLTFSAGPHFCLGSSLARLEGAIVLGTFASRFVDPEPVSERVVYKPNPTLRGSQRLEVTFSDLRPPRNNGYDSDAFNRSLGYTRER